MKRMILMTLALTIMAAGSAKANDAVDNRGPKKRGVVVTISPDPLLNLILGGAHHDCCHSHMHKPKPHPHHGKCDRIGGRHHGGKDKHNGKHDAHRDAPHKGDKHNKHKDNGGKPRGRW